MVSGSKSEIRFSVLVRFWRSYFTCLSVKTHVDRSFWSSFVLPLSSKFLSFFPLLVTIKATVYFFMWLREGNMNTINLSLDVYSYLFPFLNRKQRFLKMLRAYWLASPKWVGWLKLTSRAKQFVWSCGQLKKYKNIRWIQDPNQSPSPRMWGVSCWILRIFFFRLFSVFTKITNITWGWNETLLNRRMD